jgi:hypothetical protein
MTGNLKFILAISFLVGAYALYGYGVTLQNKAIAEKYEQEKAQVADFFMFKDKLESCHLKTKDKEIKVQTFSILLDHVVKQNLPSEKLIEAIDRCEATL